MEVLTGKAAIVTGGSKGYGAGIAEVLKTAGVKVWITARHEEGLQETSKRLDCSFIKADVTKPEDWDMVIDTVLREAGRLDILVNNAGAGGKIAPLAEMTDEEIDRCLAVNLTGAIYGCRRAAKILKRQKSGTIINISSVCQKEAWPGFAVYSAAKAGLNLLSKCLYTELRKYGVRVTTLVPSWGDTDFSRAAGLRELPAEVKAKVIKPKELGEIVLAICALPAHLAIEDVTVWPLVQEVVPL
ncbi:MAG: SDR family oxidoreductase [Spirochaetota bacterium]